jgi:hypothetical protein
MLSLFKLILFSVVAIGGGMTSLPGRNFARFNLMVYILFSLIVRTGYQGKQFEFMVTVRN